MERTSPSSACRAAACAGESASDGGSARISTRPVARSRLIAGGRKSCALARSRRGRAGRWRRGSTAAGFSPSVAPSAVTGDCTCTPSPCSSVVRASRSRPSPAEPMTAGPGSSGCPGLVAAQHGRARQAELLGDGRADAGVGEVAVPVTHWRFLPRAFMAVRPWVRTRGWRRRPGRRRRRSRSGRACRGPPRAASWPAGRRSGRRSRRTGARPPATSR